MSQERKARWTAGPWAVNPFRAQVDAFAGTDCLPEAICQMRWPTTVRSEAETDANARLISAAPELYAVLHELFVEGPITIALVGNPNACAALEAKARAALAKATTGGSDA